MKKIVLSIFFIIIGNFAFGQMNVTLDEAIYLFARNIEAELPQNTIIAVINISSSSEKLSLYIIDQLMDKIINGKKLIVVDRQQLNLIENETKYQLSGEVSDESIQSIGKKLGAQSLISGSLRDTGIAYNFTAYSINIESGKREISSSLNVNINDPQINFLLTGSRTIGKNQIDEKEETKIHKDATRNYISIVTGYFLWGKGITGWNITGFVFDMHMSPFDSFFVVGWDIRFGNIFERENENIKFFVSASPKLGLVFPFNKNFKFFADGLLEMGSFGGLKGIIINEITVGYETGFCYYFDNEFGIELRYRGNWYKNIYLNSIGISIGVAY